MVAATIFVPRLGNAVSERRLQWLIEERPPTPREQRAVLRNPLLQVKFVARFGLAPPVVFGVINLYFSAERWRNAALGSSWAGS